MKLEELYVNYDRYLEEIQCEPSNSGITGVPFKCERAPENLADVDPHRTTFLHFPYREIDDMVLNIYDLSEIVPGTPNERLVKIATGSLLTTIYEDIVNMPEVTMLPTVGRTATLAAALLSGDTITYTAIPYMIRDDLGRLRFIGRYRFFIEVSSNGVGIPDMCVGSIPATKLMDSLEYIKEQADRKDRVIAITREPEISDPLGIL